MKIFILASPCGNGLYACGTEHLTFVDPLPNTSPHRSVVRDPLLQALKPFPA